MKNKAVILFILLTLFLVAISSYIFQKGDTVFTGKLRATNAQNSFFIEKINSSVDHNTGQENIILTLRTEWNGIYFENTGDFSKLSDQERLDFLKNTIKNTITKQFFLDNLSPVVDEVTPETDLTIGGEAGILASTVKARQYVVSNKKITAPLLFTLDNLTSDSGEVYEAFDKNAKYDFVFVVEANHLTTVGNGDSDSRVRDALDSFASYLSSNSVDYRANIIEIGGRKALYNWVNDASTFTLFEGNGTDVIKSVYDSKPAIFPNIATLSYNNMASSNSIINALNGRPGITEAQKHLKSYPQDVYFTDVKDPSVATRTSSEFFIQRYSNWLSNGTYANSNLKKAIELVGKYNQTGSSNKTTGGSNGLFGLYEAVNFLESNKDSSRKQVIVLISNQWLKSDKVTINEFLPTILGNNDKDADAKDKFTTWFTGKMLNNNFNLLSSTSLWESSTTITGSPYNSTGSVDRLGHTATDTYDSPIASSLHPLEFKILLKENMKEYEASVVDTTGKYTFQNYLSDTLMNYVGKNRFYQKWYINFTNSVSTFDWKKILLSVKDFTLPYSDDASGTSYKNVLTTTVLTKPISDVGKEWAPAVATDILTYNRTETNYDRYYYTQVPTIIAFTSPDETLSSIFWYPNNQKNYDLNFTLKKYKNIGTIPADAKLLDLKVKVFNGSTEITGAVPTIDFTKFTVQQSTMAVNIPFTQSELNVIRPIVRASGLNQLTISVSANLNGELINDTITTNIDFIGPVVTNSSIVNESASEILKALGIFKNDPNENEYIEALTTAIATDSSPGYLYVRNETTKDSRITLKFTLVDSNLLLDSSGNVDTKYYYTVIHSKFESAFVSVLLVTVDKTNNTTLNVTINGKMKPDSDLSVPMVKDNYGNESPISGLNINQILLPDPNTIPVNLKSTEINDYSLDSTVDISPKTYVKGSINTYNLNFGNQTTTFINNQTVGLLVPFTQDKSNVDTPSSGNIVNFGTNINSYLSYETWRAATIYPTPSNYVAISGYVQEVPLKTRSGASLYDGIYGVQYVFPVNRAGGIAGFVYDSSLTANANISKLYTSAITTKQYRVDTIPPKLNKIIKTNTPLKDNTKTYVIGTDFNLGNTNTVIDSGYNSITYNDNLFTGSLSKGLKGKAGDIYTVVLNDVSLPTKNTSPGDLNASTNNTAKAKFYTYKISTDNSFSGEDLAGNSVNNLGNIGVIINSYPNISSVTYGSNVLTFNDIKFTKSNTLLFNKNSYAGAITYLDSSSVYPGNISTNLDLPVPNNAFLTNGKKFFNTYSFDEAGWIKNVINTYVYDTMINTSFSTLTKVVFTKTGSLWNGKIDFGNISEYVGLSSFTMVFPNATTISIPDNIFQTTSSETIGTTRNMVVSGNEKKPVILTFSSGVPSNSSISAEVTDKLGNIKTFTVPAIFVSNLKIIGREDTDNKQKESIVNIEGKSINIRATKDTNK